MARPACHAAIPSPERSRIHGTMPALWSRQIARRFVPVFDVSAVAVESVLTHAASERRAIFLISFVRDAGVCVTRGLPGFQKLDKPLGTNIGTKLEL